MKIRDVLSPTAGLFSSMPQDVWGEDLDPVHLDIELFTRIGALDAAPLFRHFVVDGILDTKGLADLLFQRYAGNWKHIWEALRADYDVFITSMNDETRTVTRDKSDLETRQLQDAVTEGGTDTTTDTYKDTIAVDSSSTKTGESTDSGTVNTNVDSTNTDSGSTTLETGIYGVGSSGLVNQSSETTSDNRDSLGNSATVETRALEGTNQESVTGSDKTSHTGTVDHATVSNKTSTADKTGTVGTVGNELEKETFHSEGSSPLRTFQALIQEELDGRSGQTWNFTELVIRDVQAMIASMIWRRQRG